MHLHLLGHGAGNAHRHCCVELERGGQPVVVAHQFKPQHRKARVRRTAGSRGARHRLRRVFLVCDLGLFERLQAGAQLLVIRVSQVNIHTPRCAAQHPCAPCGAQRARQQPVQGDTGQQPGGGFACRPGTGALRCPSLHCRAGHRHPKQTGQVTGYAGKGGKPVWCQYGGLPGELVLTERKREQQAQQHECKTERPYQVADQAESPGSKTLARDQTAPRLRQRSILRVAPERQSEHRGGKPVPDRQTPAGAPRDGDGQQPEHQRDCVHAQCRHKAAGRVDGAPLGQH